MKLKTLSVQRKSRNLITLSLFVLAGILYGLFIFWIDEGKHDFKGLLQTGNIAGLLFYILPAVALMIFLYEMIKKYVIRPLALIMAILIGTPLSFFIIIGGFMLISFFL